MFGWMGLTGGSHWVSWAVVPTIVIPFAVVSVACSAVATFIAGLFGVDLKWEGPKRLLEVLLKPRVLITALVLNVLFIGGAWGWRWFKSYPRLLWTVERKNRELQKPTPWVDTPYSNWTQRNNSATPPPGGVFPRDVQMSSVAQVWKTTVPNSVFGAATVSGASVFVGSDDGYVYELSRKDGSQLRSFYVGTEITPEPIIWNGRMFVGEGIHSTHHARIYSFNLQTGGFIGAFQTKGHTEGTPVIATVGETTTLFVMAGADGIYAVDPSTLQERWHQVGLGHIDSEVRVAGQLVYFATGIEKGSSDRTHQAYALDFNTGKIVWRSELPASGWMAPVVTETDVCFGVGEIYTESTFGEFACYDRAHGTPRMAINMDAPVMGVPFQLGSTIVTSDLQGQVCGINWPNGWRRWCHQTFNKTFASATFDGKRYFLYPSAKDGLHVLDAETGLKVIAWKPTESEGAWAKSNSRVVVQDDGWFLTDMGGNVRMLKPVYGKVVSQGGQ